MRISDWSSDVCSSDLDLAVVLIAIQSVVDLVDHHRRDPIVISRTVHPDPQRGVPTFAAGLGVWNGWREHRHSAATAAKRAGVLRPVAARSEEHTSELQSLMRISYAVFSLNTKPFCRPQITPLPYYCK